MSRIAFVGLHRPGRSPNQRFRVEQFLPHVRARGHDVEYVWLLDERDNRTFYGAGHFASKARVALAAAQKLWRAAGERYDIVFVLREAFFLGGPWAERRFAARGAKLIYDFDDALWVREVSPANAALGFLKNTRKIPELIRMARLVFCGNETLARYARAFNARVEVVPSVVDTDLFVPAERATSDAPVTIGWMGSPSTAPYFDAIVPALVRVRRRYGERVRFRFVGDARYAAPALDLRGEAWSAAGEVAALQSFDIGLMPLPDTEWARGKCGFKAIQTMAVGAAAVVSPVGVNRDIVRAGETGLWATSEDEWVEALARLIDDAPLRARLGMAGRRAIVERYSLAAWRDRYVSLIESVLC